MLIPSRLLTVDDLGIVSSDSANHLHRGVVMDSGDSGLTEELWAKLRVTNS